MKTAAALLFAVTLSSSLFLQSSAAPDPFLGKITSGLGTFIGDVGNTAGGAVTGAGKIADKTFGALVGKGLKTCPAFDLFLADLGGVLTKAQERLYDLITVFIKGLDEASVNASGALKELYTKLSAPLKVLLEALPKLLKALLAAVAKPTDEALNKVEADIKQLEPLLVKLKDVLAQDTAGLLSFGDESTVIAIDNSIRDGFGAFKAVVIAIRRTDRKNKTTK